MFVFGIILSNKNYVLFFCLVESSNIKENEEVFSQQESSERKSPPTDMDDENGSTETVEQAPQEHDGAGAQVGNLKESPIEKLLKIIAFNSPFPSCFEPRCKSEAKCRVFIMKISFIHMQTKLIFIWKTLHLTSLP